MSSLVSCLVLNYRSGRDTVRCVRALLNQKLKVATQNTLRYAPPVTLSTVHQSEAIGTRVSKRVSGATQDDNLVEILIIDNHSGDDSIGIIRNTFQTNPQVRILEANRNLGYGGGNNFGDRFATGKYVLIINPDNELELEGLSKMIEAMEADSSIGILAPRLVYPDGTARDSYRSFPSPWHIFIKRTFLRHFFPEQMGKYLQWNEDETKVRDVDWIAGACFLLPQKLFVELGGFDPQFFLFFEDTDLCRRVWQTGKRVVYFPLAAAADRKHRLSQGGFFTIFTKWTVREHLRSAVKYFWKWRGEPLR